MAEVKLTNVEKIYPGDVHAVNDLTLSIGDGEFVVLVGPSGCGKSTVLRMLAGLEEITRGEIRIGQQRVNEMSPQERDVAMVFQNYALYPHKTVRGNLEFPLRMLGISKSERRQRVQRVAEQLGLMPLLKQRPKHLSGGQRQRVAMGRAMVREPQVFLLDEPLSNLDAKLRVRIRTEIAQLQQQLGVTTLYVTHDQVEAMTLGDRVAVLSGGRLQQVGTGAELYERPANLFVAAFIGSPRMNFFKTTLDRQENGTHSVQLGESRLQVPSQFASTERLDQMRNKEISLGLRPEAFSLTEAGAANADVTGNVKAVEALGHETIVYVETPLELSVPEEETASATDHGAHGQNIVVRLPGHTSVPRAAESISLNVARELLHLFDQHGNSLRTNQSEAS